MPESTDGRVTLMLVLSTAVAVVGNSLLYGYNIGVLNTPAPIIRQFYQDIYYDRGGNPLNVSTQPVNGTAFKKEGLTTAQLELLWSVTVSIFVAFGMIGAFVSGKIADVFGRRGGCMLVSVVMIIASVLGGLTKVAMAPEMLIAHRAVVGIHNGCSISLASLYLAEISPKSIRGAIGTCHQLAITVGILLAQIFGLRELMGTELLWPVLVGFQGIPCVISLVLFFFCPESPRFLLLKKKDEEGARKALVTLRGTENVEEDMEEMRTEGKQAMAQPAFSAKMLLTSPELRMPLIIAVLLQVAQQWSGINAVFYYSEFIFTGAGVAKSAIPYAIVGTGTINVITTIISVPLMEKAGRRPLLIWPMCVMAISMLVLTISLNLQAKVNAMAYVSIICMHTYVVGFALGLGPIPFIVVSELFRQAPRSTAMSVALVFQWMCNFVLALCFRFLQEAAGPYTFVVFIVILVASILFIFFFVPETKNKTFEEIAQSVSMGRARGKSRTVNLGGSSKDEVELMDSAKA